MKRRDTSTAGRSGDECGGGHQRRRWEGFLRPDLCAGGGGLEGGEVMGADVGVRGGG